MMPATILRESDGLLFVDKPSGMLVHNSEWAGPRERSLVEDVRDLVGPGFHPLHRLDRGTSGVVAFAREGLVAAAQASLMRDDVDKRYWALVRGHVKAPLEIDHPIKDDDTGVVREAKSAVRPLLLSSVDRCSLVEIRLFSGRRHQARRHLKHVSHPVIGDATHGKGPLNRAFRDTHGLARLGLHARRLVLTHPTTNARAGAVSGVPGDLRGPLEKLFGAALDELIGAPDLDEERGNSHVAGDEVSR